MDRVYLDHNATTPLDPRVLEAMLPWLGRRHGNPSSVHAFGQAARDAVEGAREKVAALIGAAPPEIVFTASGTEANNTAIASAAAAAGHRGRIVISAVEHPSVIEAAARAQGQGMTVVRVPVDAGGVVDPERFLAEVDDDTRLAALMLANNEVGTLQPVARVARGCRRRSVPCLTDAVQAAGKVAVDIEQLDADLLSLGAHKLQGPLGVGALWVRGGVDLDPLLVGGGQERRRRAGTENVAGVVGFGRAAELAAEELVSRGRALAELRDRLEGGLMEIPGAHVHCAASPRLPNTSNFRIAGIDGGSAVIRLDLAGFAVSAGSACSSGAPGPSRTLEAMGVEPDIVEASLRVSFGPTNSLDEVDRLLAALRDQRVDRDAPVGEVRV